MTIIYNNTFIHTRNKILNYKPEHKTTVIKLKQKPTKQNDGSSPRPYPH